MYIGWDIGIKHLSYCILNKEGIIKEWDIIDLTGVDACEFKCIASKKNGDMCSKSASFIDKNTTSNTYCKVHCPKEDNSIIPLFTCFKCSKLCKKHHIPTRSFYCMKHYNSLEDTIKLECDTLIVKNIAKEKLEILGSILIDKLNMRPSLLDVDHIVIENQPVLKNPTMKSIQMILYTYYLMSGKDNYKDYTLKLVPANSKLKFTISNSAITNIKAMKNKYQRNKKLAIEYCRFFITSYSNWITYFESVNKKDDLADAYLLIKYYYDKSSI